MINRRKLASVCVVLAVLLCTARGLGAAASAAPLRFLGNANLAPIIFVQDGHPTGVVVDLANAVVQKAAFRIQVEVMDWPTAQALVADGQADGLLQINPTPDREQRYDFSDPLLESDFVLLRKTARTDIQQLPSLLGKKVGVEQAGFPAEFLRRDDRIQAVVLPNWQTGFAMLQAEQIDAILVDRWVGEYQLYLHRVSGVTVVEPPLATDHSRIAVKKGNRALLARINEGLHAIDRDGTRQQILQRWRGKEVVYLSREVVQGLLFCLVLLAVALVMVLMLRPLGWLAQMLSRNPRGGPRAIWFGYGLAVGTTGLAALARWLVPWALTPAPYLGFYPAVVISAALGGVGPGLASTFMSLALVNLVFGQFNPSDHGALARQVIWVVASVGVSVLAGMQRAARIREQQQAEALRAAEQRERTQRAELEALLAALPTPVFLARDPEIRSLVGNPAAQQLLQASPDQNLSQSAPAEGRAVFTYRRQGRPIPVADLPLRIAIRTGQPVVSDEFEVVCPDGTSLTMLCNALPLFDAQGQVRGGIAVLMDITARKHVEETLRELTVELEQRVQARTADLQRLTGELAVAESRERKLLGEVLHDGLQQYLVAARMRLEMLQRTTPSAAHQDVVDLLTEAIAASRALTAELSPPILHTAGFVAALRWLAKWMQDTHRLTVTINSAEGVDVGEAMKVLLFRSVRELLFNTVKHAGVHEAALDISRQDGSMQIVVSDHGKGFDPERIDISGATGLGLASIRQRLEYLGGTLDVASAPGQGSRFTLTVPLQP